jgi:hypothetical protein
MYLYESSIQVFFNAFLEYCIESYFLFAFVDKIKKTDNYLTIELTYLAIYFFLLLL